MSFQVDPNSNVTSSNGAPGVATSADLITSGNITKINSNDANDFVIDVTDNQIEISKDVNINSELNVRGYATFFDGNLLPGLNNTGGDLIPSKLTLGSQFSPQIRTFYPQGSSSDVQDLQFKTSASNTSTDNVDPRMTIRSLSGNVGINTANPVERLHVVGTTKTTDLTVDNALNVTGTTQIGDELDVQNKITVLGSTAISASYDGSTNSPYTGIINLNGDGTGYKYAVRSGSNEIVTVFDQFGGRVGINQDTPVEALDINGNIRVDNVFSSVKIESPEILIENPNPNDNQFAKLFLKARNDILTYQVGTNVTTQQQNKLFLGRNSISEEDIVVASDGNVGVGKNPNNQVNPTAYRLDVNGAILCGPLDSSGPITSAGIVVTSDSRIKKEIEDLNDEEALKNLMEIKPRTYKYIDPRQRTDKKVYGFIAQELRESLPYAVDLRPNSIPSIMKYSKMEEGGILHLDDHELQDGDILRLEDNDNNEHFRKLTVVDKNHIKLHMINDKDTERNVFKGISPVEDNSVFVYGKHIQDFHFIKKDYVFTLNVAATQELLKRQHKLTATLTQEQQKSQEMMSLINQMRKEIDQLKQNQTPQ